MERHSNEVSHTCQGFKNFLKTILYISASKVTLEHRKKGTMSSYAEEPTYHGRFCPPPDGLWQSTKEAMCPLKNPACSLLLEYPWKLLCRSLLGGPLRIQIGNDMSWECLWKYENEHCVFLTTKPSTKSLAKFYLFCLSLSTEHPSLMGRHKSGFQCQSVTALGGIRRKINKVVSFHVGSSIHNLED